MKTQWIRLNELNEYYKYSMENDNFRGSLQNYIQHYRQNLEELGYKLYLISNG